MSLPAPSRAPAGFTLSILMPVYNEAATLAHAIDRLLGTAFPCDIELVIVDDGSTDATPKIIDALTDPRIRKGRHPVNKGKGAAVKTAAAMATGEWILVFDADLEYSPSEIERLLDPVFRGDARVVYGARTFGSASAHSFWFVIGNKLTTFAANALFNSWISDLHTCLKLLPRELFLELDLKEDRFGLDTELTGKLLARRIWPFEVSISYKARSHEEGKKITWRDGLESLWILTRIRMRLAASRRLGRA